MSLHHLREKLIYVSGTLQDELVLLRSSELTGLTEICDPHSDGTQVTTRNLNSFRTSCSYLDVFDGTPVLDIKPYTESYRVDGYKLAEWNRQLIQEAENTQGRL